MITRPARRRAPVDDPDASGLATVDVPVFRLSEALAPQIFRALRPAFLALDEAFHRRLAESAGHSQAWAMLEAIKAQMDRVRYLSFSGASPFPLLIRQHAAIVEALARRKRRAAESAMRQHLREILT